MIAFLNCLFLVYNGWDRCSSWVDLSITIKICSSILGLVIKAICSNNLLGSSIYIEENLLRAFRYCCLFCISPRLYSSSITLLAFVTLSVWKDNFNPSKTSSLV